MASMTAKQAPLPSDRTRTETKTTVPTRWQGPCVALNLVVALWITVTTDLSFHVYRVTGAARPIALSYVLIAASTSVSIWLIVWMLRAPHPLKRGLTNYLTHW